jgi:hypothetical protein
LRRTNRASGSNPDAVVASWGRTEEEARNLLTVLRVRGIAVTDAYRERILSEKDPERLERWLENAAVAASVTAVLDEPN